jgi:hypothetical protein
MNHLTTVHDMELLKPISVFSKIREDILNKMFTSVITTPAAKLQLASLTPAVNLLYPFLKIA